MFANSDEHRGRCGGGVPGTAVFGTRGGLTGILSSRLDRKNFAQALRERHTFVTTGQCLVGLVLTKNGTAIQGDEIEHLANEPLGLVNHFLGDIGFSSIEAFDASGQIWQRRLLSETDKAPTLFRVAWGGARLSDRYCEAIWTGTVETQSAITRVVPFGGLEDNPEDQAVQKDAQTICFHSHTSGDVDGVHVYFDPTALPSQTSIRGTIGGYVKIGDALTGNPHKPQPNFQLEASWDEVVPPGGKSIGMLGGCELFVRVKAIPEISLPRRIQ